MKLHESYESIRDITFEAVNVGKLALVGVLDWIDQKLCDSNDLGSED